MSGAGVVRLGDLVGRVERLEARCTRCPRRGLLRLARLLRAHGPEISLPDLGQRLAGDCPRRDADYAERCAVVFPQLRELAAKDQPDSP